MASIKHNSKRKPDEQIEIAMNIEEILPTGAVGKANRILQQAGLELSADQLDKLLSYYALLIEKNRVMNLTAITAFEEVVRKHFADSLAPLVNKTTKIWFNRNDVRILDLGTGAGFPGLPLAIALPEADVTLADSLQKRIVFLQNVKEQLQLTNISVLNGRAEELGRSPEHREEYDLVVSRAVADLRVLCEYCLPFVKNGGHFVAWKGPGAPEEAEGAREAIRILGGEEPKFAAYTLPGDDVARSLVIIEKIKTVPEKYPRRAGIPSKRPL